MKSTIPETLPAGTRYGRRIIIGPAEPYRSNPRVFCRCGCGDVSPVYVQKLLRGEGRSCFSCRTDSATTRFWSRVNRQSPDSCWPWTGRVSERGYGVIKSGGRNVRAHRLSWELHFGPVPAGIRVLHRCDNPPCCNPAHLFLGTDADNVADMQAKGRNAKGDTHGFRKRPDLQPRGEQHGRAKLTEQQVAEIRRRYSAGTTTQSDLAREYGISQGAISFIVTGKHWKSCEG